MPIAGITAHAHDKELWELQFDYFHHPLRIFVEGSFK